MNMPVLLSPWLMNMTPGRTVSRRLIIFPFAGAGPNAFRSWIDRLPHDIEILAVQLPGRGSRIREAPIKRLDILVDELIHVLVPYLNVPYAFFGHSMGALISFELSRRLRTEGNPPEQLHVSSYPAPHLPFPYRHLYELSEAGFIEEMRKLSGTPAVVFECPELLELVLPTLRADFEVLATYRYRVELPLECPIFAMGGKVDPIAGHEHIEAWRDQTRGSFSLTMFEGHHFYFENEREAFLRILSSNLRGNGHPLSSGQ
jgi:surfactin synthase thioesterase subunit